MNEPVNFRAREFLRGHIKSILDFYEPHLIDDRGGFNHNFLDDGTAFDPETKHLVSSCRMILNYCNAEALFGATYRKHWQWGLDYLRHDHRRFDPTGYVWLQKKDNQQDNTNYCYGLAFVLLAYASAAKAGDVSARADLGATWDLLEQHFWCSEHNLYLDEISADWSKISDYRGQNANMHLCEALIAAFEATGENRFLDRAMTLARRMTVELAETCGGLVWEHYDANWHPDWDFNRDDPKNLYRPWGFQPGHQTEWAKLLLQLNQITPQEWLPARAATLFNAAVRIAWDQDHGGLCYSVARDGTVCDDDKYFWVQAESFAAAALLGIETGDERYWQWYDRIWQYCWQHFVDHQHGAWYRVLTRDNKKVSNRKSEAGAKCDYHTIGACSLVLAHLNP